MGEVDFSTLSVFAAAAIRQIVSRMVEGFSVTEIARELETSRSFVNTCLAGLREELGS